MSDDEAEDRAGKARVKWPRVLREDPSAEEDHHDDKASPSEEELRMEMDDDDGDEVAIPGDWTVHGKPVADGPAAFQVVYHGEPFYFTAPAEKKKGRPKLDKTAGKKKTATTTAAKPSRPGRFYKNLLPLAKSIDEQRIQSETVLALSRCVDVMADSIAEAYASFAKPIPEDDAGHERQMLSGVLAFNAIFARIPATVGDYHDLCSAAVNEKLDLYLGVDSSGA